jgi:nucleotide-binding universal stress UspA family protein
MKAIVCGTDFSEPARQAARVAAALAGKLGCRLILVHVDDALPARDGAPVTTSPAPRDTLEQQAQELRAKTTAPVETSVVYGRVPEHVILEAGRFGARLIVVASLGHSQGRGWLVGSNAERIVQHSDVPVLVVRQPQSLLEWVRGGGPLRAVVCSDMTYASRAALLWAQELCGIGPCNLELTYVAWPQAELPKVAPVPAPLGSPWASLEASLVDDLRSWAAGTGDDAVPKSFRVLVNWGRTESAIAQHAATTHSSLIVAGTHRRSHVARLWQGSVSRALLHHADTNVACVPPGNVGAGDAAVIKRVLAAVDLSDSDDAVVRTALGVAPRVGEVHVLHVLEEGAGEQAEREASQRLDTLLRDARQHARVETHVTVRRGATPHAVIAEYAERMAADAICMGARRRSRAADRLLGSQARGVVMLARVPVILVPAPTEAGSPA